MSLWVCCFLICFSVTTSCTLLQAPSNVLWGNLLRIEINKINTTSAEKCCNACYTSALKSATVFINRDEWSVLMFWKNIQKDTHNTKTWTHKRVWKLWVPYEPMRDQVWLILVEVIFLTISAVSLPLTVTRMDQELLFWF